MERFTAKSIIVGAAVGVMSLLQPAQASQNEYIWSNINGFQSAASCEVTKQSETRFHISMNSGDSSMGYENLRSLRNKNKIVAYVVDGSLVKLSNERDSGNYEAVTVVGVHEAPGVNVRGHVAQRNYNGLLFENSLKRIDDYIIQITARPTIEGGEMSTDLIPSTNIKYVEAFLQPVKDGDDYLFYKCNDKNYLVFDLHRGSSQGALARVGINWDITSLLRHIRTYSLTEAEQAIQEQAKTKEENSSVLGTIRNFFGTEEKNVRSNPQGSHLQMTAGATDDAEIVVDMNEGDDHSEEDPRALQTAEQQARDDEEVEAAKANQSSTPIQVENEIPVFNGALEYTVCMPGGTLNVRGLNSNGEVNMDDELFQVGRYAIVKPADNFGDNERVVRVNGQDIKFVLVQFPNVSGENFGWVAEEYVKPSSHCAGFQRAQGGDQTITCTNSGTLNVYELNNSGALVASNFNANQFEEIALRTDIDADSRFRTVNGQRIEYTAVVFPGRNNTTGWVAKNFVKTKNTCEAFKRAGTPSSSVSGNLFPLQGRPTHSYLSAPRCFGCGRSGGRKHAATDLYRPLREKIQSIADGRVLRQMYYFYQGTYAIEVKNEDGKVIRYGETNGKAFKTGRVKKGDKIGEVGKTHCCTPMLHFEMYDGRAGNASLSGGGAYRRRWDLMNPTSTVRQMEKARFGDSY